MKKRTIFYSKRFECKFFYDLIKKINFIAFQEKLYHKRVTKENENKTNFV